MQESQEIQYLRNGLHRWALATGLIMLDIFILDSVMHMFQPMPHVLFWPIMTTFQFCFIIVHVTLLVTLAYLFKYVRMRYLRKR